ncbi:MAG: DUF7577 domain-containing protein [Thermoplasmatota archaeon]
MKKCSVCGKEFEDEKDYCDYCGIKLDPIEEGQSEEMEVEEPEDPEEEESEEEEIEVEEEIESEDEVDIEEESEEFEVEEEEIEEEVEAEEEELEPAEGDKRRCPICGTLNPAGAKFCMNCAANILSPEEEQKELTLLLPGGKQIKVTDEEQALGREDFVGTLPDEKLKYISRRDNPEKPDAHHFKVFYEDGNYYVEDEDSANGTWLKGENIQGQGQKMLSDADEIKPANEISVNVRIE